MNELIRKLNWLNTEKSRLEERYYNESNEAKSKILLWKTVEISMMMDDVKYEMVKLEEEGA